MKETHTRIVPDASLKKKNESTKLNAKYNSATADCFITNKASFIAFDHLHMHLLMVFVKYHAPNHMLA